ncbi:DNA cytosine methyltransferase [Agromyces humi]|uniref:DNA cytosine methyltransferase n=1 Tax=Agromyces humi TaxID=1766800 RepID=UPI0013595E4F|nr:DNA cytosine methyltransferase [Agromyces humi]
MKQTLTAASPRTVDLFAGPGGWDEGARILGQDLDIAGFDISKDACATATAAGHRRELGDVRALRYDRFRSATGLIASAPCPTFSASGRRTGNGEDYQKVLDVWTSVGWDIPIEEALESVADVEDRRTALLAEAGLWALTLPNLEWAVFEQVPSVEFAWEDLSAELFSVGWDWCDVLDVDSADYGVASRRRRTFLVARKHSPSTVGFQLEERTTTMAEALGWGLGHQIVTRGNRKPTGGNRFSADKTSWCLTGSSRTWEREDGLRLTPAEAGLLVGFDRSYPWQGSRSSQFLQAADVVSPVVAAGVLGAALNVDARQPVREHLNRIHTPQEALQMA